MRGHWPAGSSTSARRPRAPCRTADDLLAHEVAHVTKRHQSRWVQGRLVDSATSVDQLLNLLRATRK